MIIDNANHVNYNVKILSLDRYKVEPEWFKGKSIWKWSANSWKFEVRKSETYPDKFRSHCF